MDTLELRIANQSVSLLVPLEFPLARFEAKAFAFAFALSKSASSGLEPSFPKLGLFKAPATATATATARLAPSSVVEVVRSRSRPNPQLLTRDPSLLQYLADVFRDPNGQVNRAVGFVNGDRSDIRTIQSGFVGHGTDDIARSDAIVVTDFDSVSFHSSSRRTGLAETALETSLWAPVTPFAAISSIAAVKAPFPALATFLAISGASFAALITTFVVASRVAEAIASTFAAFASLAMFIASPSLRIPNPKQLAVALQQLSDGRSDRRQRLTGLC